MRLTIAALAMLMLCPSYALAQGSASGQASPATTPTSEEEEEDTWAYSAGVYFYQVVDDDNYAQPTFTADRGWLHLEARYNYEDLKTGSLWFGYNMSGGETIEWELTPMLGGVFGATDAIAPGYKGSLTWRRLEFYSEGEYVVASEEEDRFFYNWSEVTVAPMEWWRIGLVTQRTRAYETEREVQRGLIVGFSYKAFSPAIHIFNPDDSHPVVVVSAAVDF